MTIKEKLDQASAQGEMVDAIFEFKGLVQHLYQTLVEVVARTDTLATGTSFKNVDEEIKAEGVALRNIMKSVKAALDDHTEFINYKKTE